MKSLKILLVEDDLSLAKSTAKLIERFSGHQVRVTDNPETIFELCTTDEVDIVIMDINLSEASWAGEEVSGADLSRLLKTQPATAHIPIIILTAYAMANERESLMADSQANEFFTKPIRDYGLLIEKIEELAKN
ncbi:Response regulator receiver protein [Hyella patelloides LEGE 07179]|uniref:Response regulator receiver protein n=1 Tax=Hyella patelloides LEGE 07179 TaxID=945734 RepID=A0A563VM29_9CYAN|nr:response regulator [Hyella patelloides]VEP12506.1 Response regulator receiver protein [Hyella patelloides LEGE 07179]